MLFVRKGITLSAPEPAALFPDDYLVKLMDALEEMGRSRQITLGDVFNLIMGHVENIMKNLTIAAQYAEMLRQQNRQD
jgi:hypothetical protein